MFLRSLLVAGAVALRANALLVVPGLGGETVSPQDEIMGILPLSSQTPYYQQVDLFCTECPFRESGEDGEVSWTDGAQTSLSLNFSIEDSFLLANGHQIFPPPPPARITAVQHRVQDGAESEPIPLGYALEVIPVAASFEDPGLELLAVRFTVLDLDGRPVPLNTVAIGLIHDGKGNFYIAKTDIEDTAPSSVSWKQCRGKPNCLRKLLFVRMQALFASARARLLGMASKLRGSKGCHKLSPPNAGNSPFWAQGHAGHGRPEHAGHMHHMHHAGLERTVSRIVRFILIPATLGVLAGLTASALGMLVGQVVVSLWLWYRRSKSQQPNANLEEGTEFEKQGLMAESSDDLPPAYTDDESAPEVASAEKD
ncbi:hypothetical protein PHISCL_00809 [Aspergillus sclerotialis]|uniref:DUF7728 domain-containing protein n=1 Tax=Aspergillus sclerotialis TaxID=2070753 RepID=A0A3A2ZZU1_9EURO|nr:hypothetical protein PHISCL_00809 [Aspergillus sclerotialis]